MFLHETFVTPPQCLSGVAKPAFTMYLAQRVRRQSRRPHPRSEFSRGGQVPTRVLLTVTVSSAESSVAAKRSSSANDFMRAMR